LNWPSWAFGACKHSPHQNVASIKTTLPMEETGEEYERWVHYKVQPKLQKGKEVETPYCPLVWSYRLSTDENLFFQLWAKMYRNGHMIAAGSTANWQGIVKKQIYSVLGCYRLEESRRSVVKVNGAQTERYAPKFLHLVKLRNPWGCKPYTGPFSADCKKWNMYPAIQKFLSKLPADGGVFYMDWESFLNAFGTIFSVPIKRGDSARVHVHSHEPEIMKKRRSCLVVCPQSGKETSTIIIHKPTRKMISVIKARIGVMVLEGDPAIPEIDMMYSGMLFTFPYQDADEKEKTRNI